MESRTNLLSLNPRVATAIQAILGIEFVVVSDYLRPFHRHCGVWGPW
jgi:hypothetical protein